jgi:hypothetical protein
MPVLVATLSVPPAVVFLHIQRPTAASGKRAVVVVSPVTSKVFLTKSKPKSTTDAQTKWTVVEKHPKSTKGERTQQQGIRKKKTRLFLFNIGNTIVYWPR